MGGRFKPGNLWIYNQIIDIMRTYFQSSGIIVLFLLIISSSTNAQDFFSPTNRLWNPVPDKIYLQEISQKIPLDKPVTSIAVFNNQCYVVIEGSIHLLSGETIQAVVPAPVNVKSLESLNGTLWAL